MPSNSKNISAVDERFFQIDGAMIIILQPIIRYNASDNLGYLPRKNILKNVPRRAIPQITPNIIHPRTPPTAQRRIGVYEAAISM